MTETTKEIFRKYQVRKTRKQKTAFVGYVKTVAEESGYDFRVEKASLGVRNIVIGNPDTAKVIYTAHYDTCVRLPFPNFITPKNFLIYLLYQFLITGAFFPIAFIIGYVGESIIDSLNMPEAITALLLYNVYLIICLPVILFFIFGPANKNTANDNTSGVTTVLDIMSELSENERSKVAFILFDHEELGLLGSSLFASKHKAIKKNTLVINFDCVSDGETILFALKKTTKKYEDILKKAFASVPGITVSVIRGAFYPSDNSSFKGGIGVAALKKSKRLGILYMNRIHTKRDVIYREENIRFLTEGAIKLVCML